MPEVGAPSRLEALKIDRTRRLAGRSRTGIAIVVVALVLLGIAGLALLRRPPSVAVAQVREALPGEVATELTAAGYVASERRSTVAPKIAGRLVEVHVTEGQRVSEGDVIARLDDADARVMLQEAEARARAAAAQVGVARAAQRNAERDVVQARRLAQTGAISEAALFDAESQADSAGAAERAALAELRAARETVSAAQIRLRDTVIRAPFTGTISRKFADEGAVLAPAAVSDVNVGGIVELVDLEALIVEAEIGEDRLGGIEEGQPALIFLDAYPDKVYPAVAGTIRPTIDRAKATAVVKVHFIDSPSGVFPNMGAKVSFLARELDQRALETEARLRVPRSAIVSANGGDAVFVVEDGRLKITPVLVAAILGNEVALERGPPPGTRIVSSPSARLREGQKVRVAAEAT